MLADVPMGESPIGGACSVATVVISDRGKGDRPVMIGEMVETSASFEGRFRAALLPDQLKADARSDDRKGDWRSA